MAYNSAIVIAKAKMLSKPVKLTMLLFTRSMHQTEDIDAQGKLLNDTLRLVDYGKIKTTLAENFGAINEANLRRAHTLIESGRAKGKIVLEGFGT